MMLGLSDCDHQLTRQMGWTSCSLLVYLPVVGIRHLFSSMIQARFLMKILVAQR